MAWTEKVWERESDGVKRRLGTTSKGSKDRPSDAQMRAEGFRVSGYLVGYREPQKGRRVHKTFASKADAETYRRGIEQAVSAGEYVAKSDREVPLRDYVGRLLDSSWNLAPSTLADQRATFRRYIDSPLGHRPVGQITKAEVERFVADLIGSENGQGRGRTIAVYELLAKVFNAALREGVLNRSPLSGVQRPTRKTKRAVPLDPGTVEALAEAIDPRYRPAVLLGAYAGLRAGEIGGLRIQDVDFARARIQVEQQVRTVDGTAEVAGLKTDASRRQITVPASVAEELARYVESFPPAEDGRIFVAAKGGLVDHETLNKALRRAAKRIGVETHFHELRHTCAALLIAQGSHPKQVQAQLGHSSITITFDTYGHLFPNLAEEQAVKLEDVRQGALGGGKVVPIQSAAKSGGTGA